ncbi:hypothetical protein HK096_001733 [Nowakowskiella sp. JEL0078]|nr:hypothetical protein HK096_001733 [Nowakowskiella sp. JEL0078]
MKTSYKLIQRLHPNQSCASISRLSSGFLSSYSNQFHSSTFLSATGSSFSGIKSNSNEASQSGQKKKKLRNVGSDELFPETRFPDQIQDKLRKVSAFSMAQNYSLHKLRTVLPASYSVHPSLADDCTYVQFVGSLGEPADAFIFENGTFVTWGADTEQNQELLRLLKSVVLDRSYDTVETEVFDFIEDPNSKGNTTSDTIVIGQDLPSHQSKLAFSAGLARSVKLESLENQLDLHLEKNRNIPDILLKGKKLPFTRSSILRNLGELYSLRGNVNLHSELLDPPEFCWSSEKMELYFTSISKELDVSPRITVFNKKLDYANELAELLRNHYSEQHSVSLEVMIIVLISVEIVFEVVSYLDRLGYVEIDRLAKKRVFGESIVN